MMQGWRRDDKPDTYICTLSAASRSSNDLYLAAAHGTEPVAFKKMSGDGRAGRKLSEIPFYIKKKHDRGVGHEQIS